MTNEKENVLKQVANLLSRAKTLVKSEEKDGRIYPEKEKQLLDESLEVLQEVVNMNLADKVGVPIQSAKKINKNEEETEEIAEEVYERGWPNY